ncbi:MAG: serine hydrolase [Ignavibacteria bacterium]|jgi:CubicO group peptidase (beta-lactamase class C family)
MLKLKLFLVLILLPLLWSCIDENPTQVQNPLPQIEIISPEAGSQYTRGDSIHIISRIEDPDGLIRSVKIVVDNTEIHSESDGSVDFVWETSGATTGNRVIKIIAEDFVNQTYSNEVAVRIKYSYKQPVDIPGFMESVSFDEAGMDSTLLINLMNQLSVKEDHLMHGIVIARNGKLIFEEYFSGYRRDDQQNLVAFNREVLHDLASVTKSVTSALMGLAIKEEFIEDEFVKVNQYFNEGGWEAGDPRNEITLQNMITMSSGIQWDENSLPPLDPNNDLILFATDPHPWEFYLSRPLQHTPGTTMEYSEASICVIGEAIARASGIRLDVFADQYLFNELDIANRFWNVKPNNWVWASGDLFLRPIDMLKIGQLYLQNGQWKGNQLIPEEWIDKAKIKYHNFIGSSDWAQQYWYNTYRQVGYSYAWWPLDPSIYGPDAFCASGWGDQRIVVIPQYNMVVILTGGSQWSQPYLTSHQIMSQYILPSINGY